MSKRLSYTTSIRLQVVDFAETNGNRSAARYFGVDESNVRLWGKYVNVNLTKCPSESVQIEAVLPSTIDVVFLTDS